LYAKGCQREYKFNTPVNSVVLHPNQAELICGCDDGTVQIIDLTANKVVKQWKIPHEHEPPVRCVSISADAKIMAVATNTGDVYIYKTEKQDATLLGFSKSFKAHDSYIMKCAISPNVKVLATCSADQTIKLWNTNDFSLAKTLRGHEQWVCDCSFSSDSAYIVSASSDQTARLWEIAGGKTITKYDGHSRAVTAVALSDAVTDTK